MDTDRVRAMIECFERGLGVRATARALGAGRTTVARWHRKWRGVRGGAILVVGVSGMAARELMPAAAARGLSIDELIGRLASACAENALVDVVLGDRT